MKLHFPKSKALDSKWEDVGAYPSSLMGISARWKEMCPFYLVLQDAYQKQKKKQKSFIQCCLNTATYVGTDLRIGAEISSKGSESLT